MFASPTRPTAKDRFKEGIENCESCHRDLVTVVYRNGADICGGCYGIKMGYFSDPEDAAIQMGSLLSDIAVSPPSDGGEE